jgi:hypothetical protein
MASKFEKRFGISSHVRHGEAGSAPATSVEFAKSTNSAKRFQVSTNFLPKIDSFVITWISIPTYFTLQQRVDLKMCWCFVITRLTCGSFVLRRVKESLYKE